MKKIAVLFTVTAVVIAGILWFSESGQQEIAVVARPALTQQLVQQVKVEAEVTTVQERETGTRQLELTALVEGEEAEKIKVGDAAVITLRLANQQNAHGTVQKVQPQTRKAIQGNEVQDQMEVCIACETDAPVYQGLLAEAVISAEVKEQAVLVPWTSVSQKDGCSYVWVRKGQRAERRQVELGRELQEWTEIVQGIEPDDEVVTNPPEDATGTSFMIKEENVNETE